MFSRIIPYYLNTPTPTSVSTSQEVHLLTHKTSSPIGRRRHRLHNLLMALHARDAAKLVHALPQDAGVAHRALEPHRRAGLHPLRRAGLRERLVAGVRDGLAVVHLHRVLGIPGTYDFAQVVLSAPGHVAPHPIVTIIVISEDYNRMWGQARWPACPLSPEGRGGGPASPVIRAGGHDGRLWPNAIATVLWRDRARNKPHHRVTDVERCK